MRPRPAVKAAGTRPAHAPFSLSTCHNYSICTRFCQFELGRPGHEIYNIRPSPPPRKPKTGGPKAPSACRKSATLRGNPFLPAYAGQKFLPPGSLALSRFSRRATVGACENRSAAPAAPSLLPRTRRKAARTLSALNFPVCVPSIRTCRLDGTFLSYFWAVSPGRTWPAAPRWGRRCGRNGGPGARRGRYGRSSRRSAPAPPAPPRRTDSPARRCWRRRRAGPGR